LNKAPFVIILALVALVIFLLLASLFSAGSSAGVKKGDWAKYYYFVDVYTDISNPKPPLGFDPNLNGSWFQFIVLSISGKDVSAEICLQFRNETKQTVTGEMNVETGNGTNFGWYLIRPGLRKFSKIYTDERFINYVIKDIILGNCNGTMRELVFLNLTTTEISSHYSGIIPYKVISMTTSTIALWDRETGVLINTCIVISAIVEETQQFYYSIIFYYDISESNLPIIPK